MSSAKWQLYCLGHISVVIFCIFSEIVLNDTSYKKVALKAQHMDHTWLRLRFVDLR